MTMAFPGYHILVLLNSKILYLFTINISSFYIKIMIGCSCFNEKEDVFYLVQVELT